MAGAERESESGESEHSGRSRPAAGRAVESDVRDGCCCLAPASSLAFGSLSSLGWLGLCVIEPRLSLSLSQIQPSYVCLVANTSSVYLCVLSLFYV